MKHLSINDPAFSSSVVAVISDISVSTVTRLFQITMLSGHLPDDHLRDWGLFFFSISLPLC